MTIVYLLSEIAPGSATTTALNLARIFSAEGHPVKFVVKKTAEATEAELRKAAVGEVTALRLGGAFDVMTPVRLSKILTDRCVVHSFTIADASMTERARRLLPDPSGVKTVLWLEGETPGPRSRVEADTVIDPHTVVPASALSPTPYAPDTANPTLLYCGPLRPGCSLEKAIDAVYALRDTSLRLRVVGEGLGRDVMPLVRYSRHAEVADRIEWVADTPLREAAKGCIGAVVAADTPMQTVADFSALGLPHINVEDTPTLRAILADPAQLNALSAEASARARSIDDFVKDIRKIYGIV